MRKGLACRLSSLLVLFRASLWLIVAAASFLLQSQTALANQVPTSSTGAGPVVKTYPSGLTMTMAIGGSTVIGVADGALNGYGGTTSAMLSPPIAPTSKGLQILVSAAGCNATVAICSNRGTMTITFSKAVTNPVLHLSGLGGQSTQGANTSNFGSRFVITGATGPTTSPTFTLLNSNSNMSVISTTTAGITTANGGTTCTVATAAGCGSVQINGTVVSVSFRIDLLMSGNWTNTGAGAQDGVGLTVSVDEDFGDAPTSYETGAVASHIVGNVRLGAATTVDNASVTNAGTLTPSPLASANASSDGSDDGVVFPTLIRTVAATIPVSVTGAGGFLQGWIDWNDDGNFTTAGDQIATNAVDGGSGDADGVVNGVIQLAVTPPVGAALTPTIARFRYSTTSGLGRSGLASDGEVEDYEVTILPQRADLSLTKSVSNAAPLPGAAISYTLTISSAALTTSTATATGVTVQDTLPAGFTFVSATGTGTYNSGTGVWTVGSLAPGANASITINGTVSAAAGTTVTNIAQVSASSLPDPDSTVNNGVTTEDDYATIPFTVATPQTDLVIAKTNSVSGVSAGGTTTYTVTVTNNGPQSSTGAIVTDTPVSGLSCPAGNAVTITGSGVPPGSFTVANLTGAGIALGTLAVGQSAILTFTCNVP